MANMLNITSQGIVTTNATGTFYGRILQQPAAGLVIDNPDGVAADPEFILANDLAALEALTGTGFSARTAVDTWALRTLQQPAAGITIANPAGIAGDPTFALANDLAALEGLASTGIAVRSAADTWVQRSIAAGTGISVANGDGVAANPTISINAATVAQTLTADTGGALSPTAGNFNILGGPGITTVGAGSTITINNVVFTDTTATTLAVDNGYNATAAGTYNMPATALQGEMIIVFCDTAGAVVLDCPALNFIRIGATITSSGGTATSTAQGDSLTLRYRLSSLTWEAVSVVGTWLTA